MPDDQVQVRIVTTAETAGAAKATAAVKNLNEEVHKGKGEMADAGAAASNAGKAHEDSAGKVHRHMNMSQMLVAQLRAMRHELHGIPGLIPAIHLVRHPIVGIGIAIGFAIKALKEWHDKMKELAADAAWDTAMKRMHFGMLETSKQAEAFALSLKAIDDAKPSVAERVGEAASATEHYYQTLNKTKDALLELAKANVAQRMAMAPGTAGALSPELGAREMARLGTIGSLEELRLRKQELVDKDTVQRAGVRTAVSEGAAALKALDELRSLQGRVPDRKTREEREAAMHTEYEKLIRQQATGGGDYWRVKLARDLRIEELEKMLTPSGRQERFGPMEEREAKQKALEAEITAAVKLIKDYRDKSAITREANADEIRQLEHILRLKEATASIHERQAEVTAAAATLNKDLELRKAAQAGGLSPAQISEAREMTEGRLTSAALTILQNMQSGGVDVGQAALLHQFGIPTVQNSTQIIAAMRNLIQTAIAHGQIITALGDDIEKIKTLAIRDATRLKTSR